MRATLVAAALPLLLNYPPLKSDDDNSCVDLPPEPPSVLDQPVSPPPMSDWTRSARILQPWGPTQFELVRNASRLAPLLGSAYGFNTVILLPAPAHLSYCAADGPCALTAADIAAGVDAFRAAGWRVILYTSFMHLGEAQAWTNGSVNRQHPDWAQRNGSGVAWKFEGSHSPLSPCSEDVLTFTQSYATAQAAALHQPDATMLDNNEFGPLAWGCSNSGCGYEPPCAAAFDKYVRARFNSSMLRSCFGVDISAGPVVPPPISARGSSLHGLWIAWRNRAMALVNRRFGDQLRSGGRRLLTNTAIDWPDWSLAQDLQYAAEDVVLSEVYDSDPMLLHASLSLGVGLSQGRPFWAALYQNEMKAVEMAPGVVRRLLTFAAAHQVAPWLVFESVLLNSSDPRAAALQSTHRWLAGEVASFRGGKMVAPVACMASAATRNSIGHNASKHVAITPSRCLKAAAALGAPVRVVYDGDYRGADEWLDGVSLLVLDGVRCLPSAAAKHIVTWSHAGGTVLASEDSGVCDDLGRPLPAGSTLASQAAAQNAPVQWTNVSSDKATGLIKAHSWLHLAADTRIVVPRRHAKHLVIFVLCSKNGGCLNRRDIVIDAVLDAADHPRSARFTSASTISDVAVSLKATKGGARITVPAGLAAADDFAIVVLLG